MDIGKVSVMCVCLLYSLNGVVLGVVELFDMHLLCTYTYIATPSDSCFLSLSLSLSQCEWSGPFVGDRTP